ncbi:MAG: peptidylprolyl isomerase [Pirellulales bacterium]|nr:peptidylprolyl isomerase [Pirellulales bacterium]
MTDQTQNDSVHTNSQGPSGGAKRKRRLPIKSILGGIGVLAVCLIVRYYWSAEPAAARDTMQSTRRQAASREMPVAEARSEVAPETVAMVNGKKVSREALAIECLRHYGEDVLESYVNKRLIAIECKKREVEVTREEVEAEIARMATSFGLPVKQWYQMLEKERGIQPAQYAEDIIWPTLALRKLASDRLSVSQEELAIAYETQFGPAVQCRIIACATPQDAEQVHAAAVKDPESFGDLAKEYSKDTTSASIMGRIPPIRKHAGHEAIEKAAFDMQDGQVSPVLEVDGQYVILKREKGLEARNVKFEDVSERLSKMIEQRKLRGVSRELFGELQKQAEVINVLNDAEKRKQMPGIAAIVSGQKVTMRELAEECIKRHGTQVLDGLINRMLIEQACEQQEITVSDEEITAEIVRAATDSVEPKPDGTPDVEGWIELVTKQQGISREVYIRDSVWPSVALKKLVGDRVTVTEDDIQRGFDANYGPKVRCRAIVLDNQRRAQEVWEKARQNPTVEYFGRLAQEYSIEASSRELKGQVPPIKKNGGQPILEREAFTLQPGEISGIIQAGGHFVILLCEGQTTPVDVKPAEVRDLIVRDIREKKTRKAMAQLFGHLQEKAVIDNYLAGTTQSPRKSQERALRDMPKMPRTPVRQ